MAANEQKSSRVSHDDLSRKRAEHALKSVEDFGSASKTKGKDKEAYVSYVKSLPAVIRITYRTSRHSRRISTHRIRHHSCPRLRHSVQKMTRIQW